MVMHGSQFSVLFGGGGGGGVGGVSEEEKTVPRYLCLREYS